ncbi:MAG: ankyrin repeat domain-containing protein, partial [Gammaproteobacteria bacterium]
MLGRDNKKNKKISVCNEILSSMHLVDQKTKLKVHALIKGHIKEMSEDNILLILEAAIAECNKDILRILMSCGVNLDVGIWLATKLGGEPTVKFLLEITASQPCTKEYIDSVKLAVKRGDEKLLTLLLSPIRHTFEVGCKPLLTKAAEYGHIHLLDFFWPRVKRAEIIAALDIAIQYSQLEFVKELQRRGVSLDELRRAVFSPVFSAARSNDPIMLNYVYETAQGEDLGHALFLAVENSFISSTEFILSKSEVEVDFIEITKETPLLASIREGCIDLSSRLLTRGANPDGVPATVPPVVLAVRKNFPAALKLLLDKGASLVLPSYNLWHEAVKENAYHVINMLGIYYRKDINESIDARGNTVLHVAVSLGHKDSVLKLIELGSDPHLPNLAGETALQLAAQRKDVAIFIAIFAGWNSLSPMQKKSVSQGELNNCTNNDNINLITSLVALGTPNIFKAYEHFIFNPDLKGDIGLDPALVELAFESVLAASEMVAEGVDSRAMVFAMIDYFGVARVTTKTYIPDISENDSISLLNSLFLAEPLNGLLPNYNDEKKKQQIVVINLAKMNPKGIHVVNTLAYMWLDHCQHMLAVFEKAAAYKVNKHFGIEELSDVNNRLQSVVGLCHFYVLMNDLYVANEKTRNDGRYTSAFKEVEKKILSLKDGVAKKLRQCEHGAAQEQLKQVAAKKLEEKVKEQKSAQVLEVLRLHSLQAEYAKMKAIEDREKAKIIEDEKKAKALADLSKKQKTLDVKKPSEGLGKPKVSVSLLPSSSRHRERKRSNPGNASTQAIDLFSNLHQVVPREGAGS